MATDLLSSSWEPQNFFRAQLSSDMTALDLDVFLDVVPAFDEGTLVIDPDSAANREIIYYNSKTALKVTCPANGRGYDNTTATSHSTGTTVIMAPIADWFNSLKDLFTTTPQGWTSAGALPDSVTYNGNRSYDLVFNSNDLTDTLSPGMRLRTTREVTAPTQCTDLESGSSQYFNKTSPAGMTFTDDFVAGAWVKLESYATGIIISRYNGTNGWQLLVNPNGQVVLAGNNAGASNLRQVNTVQSIPLNRWVHVTAQIDMNTATLTPTTNYIMIDGVDVPAQINTSGTAPTALVQAGNLEVGSANGGSFFDGKLAQVFVSSAKITQANVRTLISQGLTASLISTHSIASAYSFNGVATDLNTTNANNLTAQGSATATNADSPFSLGADLVSGYTDGTTDFGIIQNVAFSTNTTVTVQVAEGCTIPTSGGVSAVAYSTQKTPYGFPADRNKWRLATIIQTTLATTSNASFGAFQGGGFALNVPIGAWEVGWMAGVYNVTTTGVTFNVSGVALTGLSGAVGAQISRRSYAHVAPSAATTVAQVNISQPEKLTSATSFVMYTQGATTNAGLDAANSTTEIYAENAYV